MGKEKKQGGKKNRAHGRQRRSLSFINYWRGRRDLRGLRTHIARLKAVVNRSVGQENELKSCEAKLENKKVVPATVGQFAPRSRG